MFRSRPCLSALSLLLVACTAQPVATTARRPTGTVRQPSPATTSPAEPTSPLAQPAPPAAPTVAQQTLSGVVAAPLVPLTKLISNNGSTLVPLTKLVSNNGGTLVPLTKLISNNGSTLVPLTKYAGRSRASYRLLAAAEQALLQGATVQVLDAAGKPVMGQDGQPLKAVTDAEGAYTFRQPLPPGHLVLQVDLGPEVGQLVALSPPGAAEGRRVDLDLISTLTSSYVLQKYVRTQADPVATLQKLPAAVEADTRAKAAEAMAGNAVLLPDSLAAPQALATMETLRGKDAKVDQQLDEVKRLLIAAGQSDWGTGQVATEVSLGSVLGMVAAPSGELLLATSRLPSGSTKLQQGRIFRLGKDGRLAVAVPDENPFVNTPGPGGTLELAFSAFSVDAAGRVLLVAGKRIGRLEGDGRVTPLAEAPDTEGPVRVDGEGIVWTVGRTTTASRKQTVRVTSTAAGASPRPRAGSPEVAPDSPISLGSDGRATLHDPAAGQRFTYDPTTDAWTSAPERDLVGSCSVDPGGNLFVVDARARAVSQLKGEGGLTPLATLPPEVRLSLFDTGLDTSALEYSMLAVCAAPDGSAYLVDHAGRIYHLRAGKVERVAGLAPRAEAGGNSNAVSLEQPVALTTLPGGDLLVADAGRKRVLRVTPDRRTTVWGGNGQDGMAKEGQAVTEAPLSGLVRLLAGTNGDVYLLQQSLIGASLVNGDPGALFGSAQPQLLRVGADGVVHVVATVPGMPLGNSFVMASGVPHVCTMLSGVQRVGASGVLEPLGIGGLSATGASQTYIPLGLVGSDAGGTLWIVRGPKDEAEKTATLLSYVSPGPPRSVLQDARLRGLVDQAGNIGHAVADSRGRLVFGDALQRCVWRFDPTDLSFTSLAGQGGRIFTGTTPDDSLNSPTDVAFAPDGALLVLDGAAKQVKRVPPDKLD